MRCGVKSQEQTPYLSLDCRDIERYMCFSLDKFISTPLKEREALSYRETRGFKLLGKARAKGSSFFKKLKQRFKRFRPSQEPKTKVQKVQVFSRS